MPNILAFLNKIGVAKSMQMIEFYVTENLWVSQYIPVFAEGA